MNKTWFCAQIGAREHYAVPRVLHQDGRLAALYTDFWAGAFVRRMARATSATAVRSLAARFHPDLSPGPVISWNARSLAWEAGLKRQSGRQTYERFANIGSAFARQVRQALKQRRDLNPDCIFFSYDTGALEALEWCRERGVKCIVNQMDPNRVEVETVRQEEKRWPGWALQPLDVPEEYFRRREQEWALADRVIVNSPFCRDALVAQQVPSGKIVVVPLCFEAGNPTPEAAPRKPDVRLRVLFLGQVILRKGIQYLMEAAKLLDHEPIQFDVVGPIGISTAAMASAPRNLVFQGRTVRDQTANWYGQSDVFILPTLSDGFALTQLEAMSSGLPVVATPCCGDVVSDGVDGFIVPARDAQALAKTLQRYLAEPELTHQQGRAASSKAKQFTLARLADNLRSFESKEK